MKYFKCENCGSELTKNADNTYTCGYCRRTYYDDSLEKAYDRVYQNLRGTVQGIVTEELLKQKVEQIANCRQALYKARNGQFVNSIEVMKWSEEILKLSPDDAQANFYAIAAKKRWSELNKFMSQLNAREVSYLVEGFVKYLTNGQFVEKCVLSLNDLISRAFDFKSEEYLNCHKMIHKAAENEQSGIFDVELPRDVFVAYSSKDKEKAYELVEYLENEAGFTCFIAMRNLAKGVDAELKYNERLKKAIDSCQIFLLVSSKNSRARDCDAFNIEMRYVKENDISRTDDKDYASAHYELYLEKNRRRCKKRIEYLIEEYGVSRYEAEVKKFFGGLTWCTELNAVADAVFDYVENVGLEETDEEKLARERAEFERQKSAMEKAKLQAELELAKKEAELEKLKKKKQEEPKTVKQEPEPSASAPIGNIDDLYKAFKERERAEEEERKRQAEEAKRLQEEQKRKEELKKRGFEIEKGVLKKYSGNETSLVLPEEVIAVADDAFSACSKVKLLILPKTLSKIGDRAFAGLTGLSEIRVTAGNENYESANGVLYTKGGKRLLRYPAGKEGREFTPSEEVTEIAPYAFSDCRNLYSVNLSKSVAKIGASAFEKCSNVDVKNLSFVKTMGSNVFKNTVNISLSVNLAKAPSGWAEDWNGGRAVVWEKSAEVLEKKRKEAELARIEKERKAEEARLKRDFVIEKEGFYNKLVRYKGKDEQVVIPDSVGIIGEGAFRANQTIKTVRFTSNIYEIRKEAFSSCGNLYEVCFDEQAKECISIGDNAFENCNNLVRVELPEKVGNIRSITFDAFEGCRKLVEIYNRSSLELSCGSREHGHIALYAKNIYTPTSGESKILIENDYVLYADGNELILIGYCGTETELVLPDGITEINAYAFYDCKNLTSVQIPSSLKKIGYYAFAGCELQKVDYKGTLEDWFKIEFSTLASPFQNTQFYIGGKLISKLQIPTFVTEIGETAFRSCASIKSIEIPESVTSIGRQAFAFCENLTTVKIPNSVTSIGDEAFMNCEKAKIFVDSFSRPSGWKESWCKGVKAIEWKKTEAQIAEANEVALRKKGFDVKGGKLVKYLGKGGDVVIPDSITSISNQVFHCCWGLKSVAIPPSMSYIGDEAFQGCTFLKGVYIKDVAAWCNISFYNEKSNPLSYAENLYLNNELVTELVIPDTVTEIKSRAFENCKSLTIVVIPNSVTSVGSYAFHRCSNLTSVYITDIAAWCNIDFCGSDSNPLYYAKNLYLSNKSVAELIIPDTVTEIKNYAFYNCTSLTNLVIPDSVTSIARKAFYSCSSLTSVVIGNSVATIDENSFAWCGCLTSIVIPDSVTTIHREAFCGCKNLKKIFIPKSVEKIDVDAFKYCANLTIYAETAKRPKGWYLALLGKNKGSWNPDKRPVVWGATKADFDKA